jgi:hypothetical protein
MPTQNQGSLRLTLVTVEGEPIGEAVEIRLRNQVLKDVRVAKALATKPILIPDLNAFPNGLYEVEVLSRTFEPQSRFVQIAAEELAELCIVFHRRDHPDHPCPPPPPCPPPKIPDHLDEAALLSEVAIRLAGTPADGTAASGQAPQKVIWVERGDEVLVHLDSMRIQILDGLVLVSVDLETDQTRRTPLVVSFAVGRDNDPAGLVAVTDEFPRGNGLLASRWGRALQAAVWQSLLGIAKDHATERAAAPQGIAAARGRLSLQAGAALKVTGAVR